ncbi:MAG TPA: hypothetical protein VH208_10025, partial [Myxococcaceae bacterium]|nr:hypothetical protein [Myxococcaceae bacterium]
MANAGERGSSQFGHFGGSGTAKGDRHDGQSTGGIFRKKIRATACETAKPSLPDAARPGEDCDGHASKLLSPHPAVKIKQRPEDFSVKESYRFDPVASGRYRV